MLMRFAADANRVPKAEKNRTNAARSQAIPGTRYFVLAMMHRQAKYVLFRQFVSLKFSNDRSVAHHIGPVTYGDNFRKFRTDHQHSRSLGNHAVEKTENLR